MSKYAHQRAAVTMMPSTAAMISGQVIGWGSWVPPTPTEMISSPNATSRISEKRSAQWSAEAIRQPVGAARKPEQYSTTTASSQKPIWVQVRADPCSSISGTNAASSRNPVATTIVALTRTIWTRSCGWSAAACHCNTTYSIRITK